VRILLDQNIPRSIKLWLNNIKPEFEIFHTSDLGLSEVPDKIIFDKAQELGAIILTFDEDFSDIRLFSLPHTGIIRLNIWPTTVEMIIEALNRLFSQVSNDKLIDSLIIIDKTKIRIRRVN